MKPGGSVGSRRLYLGFSAANERFAAAISQKKADQAFQACFETLNWAVSLYDNLGIERGKGWVPTDMAQHMRGFRFARNRVHHQWADAMRLGDGMPFPIPFPIAFFVWYWRSELPEPADPRHRDPGGQIAYAATMADRPVLDSVAVISDAFRSAFEGE